LYAYQTTVSSGDETTELSQELRYSSPLDKSLRFDVGAYWYDVEQKEGFTHWTSTWVEDTGNGQFLPADFGDFYPGPTVIGGAIWGPQFLNSVDDPVGPSWPQPPWPDDYGGDGIGVEVVQKDTQSWSVFAGGEADFGERWTFDIGVRYNQDDKKFKASVNQNIPGEGLSPEESRSYNYWTWRTGLKFQVSDDNMVYASISNGKKSGGMDLLLGDIRHPDGVTTEPVARWVDYDIEKLTAFELGSKGRFWGGRAQYDIAIFYNDWEDILMPQILDTDPETGYAFEQPEGIDLTGGDASTYGIEASLFVILAENWDINLGGSWTDAKYDEAELASLRLFPSLWNDAGGTGWDEPLPDGRGDPVDISGNEMLRQSEWQGNFTLNYNKPIGNSWAFYSRSDVLYTGSQWVGPANQAKVPDYTVMNQRLGFEKASFRLEFWVENLFDDDTPRAAFRDVTFNNTHLQQDPYGRFSDMFPFRLTVSHPNRRTAGVSALIRF
jgi:outer membrane receptor protein involved in Fe transport